MPLKKSTFGSTPLIAPDLADTAIIQTESRVIAATKDDKPMTKDDYWRRREERDVATQAHIRRSGLWQAAIQSTGILSFANVQDLEGYLAAVAKAAEEGLKFVEGK